MHTRATGLPQPTWFKSSYSDQQGGACVEGARGVNVTMAVRDSKHEDGPVFTFGAGAWMTFTDALKAGGFGLPRP